MPRLGRLPTEPQSAIRDPALRPFQRRYFVCTGCGTVRRAFTAAGAARLAGRPVAHRWATIKSKWSLAVQREAAHRRALDCDPGQPFYVAYVKAAHAAVAIRHLRLTGTSQRLHLSSLHVHVTTPHMITLVRCGNGSETGRIKIFRLLAAVCQRIALGGIPTW